LLIQRYREEKEKRKQKGVYSISLLLAARDGEWFWELCFVVLFPVLIFRRKKMGYCTNNRKKRCGELKVWDFFYVFLLSFGGHTYWGNFMWRAERDRENFERIFSFLFSVTCQERKREELKAFAVFVIKRERSY
jgi:hypothetical protein